LFKKLLQLLIELIWKREITIVVSLGMLASTLKILFNFINIYNEILC